jgi:hypothetical protein
MPRSNLHTITKVALVTLVAVIISSEELSLGRGTYTCTLSNAGTWLASWTCVLLISHTTLPVPQQEKVAFVPRAAVVDTGGWVINVWAVSHVCVYVRHNTNKCCIYNFMYTHYYFVILLLLYTRVGWFNVELLLLRQKRHSHVIITLKINLWP